MREASWGIARMLASKRMIIPLALAQLCYSCSQYASNAILFSQMQKKRRYIVV